MSGYENAWPARALGERMLHRRREYGYEEAEVDSIAPRRSCLPVSSIPGLTEDERAQFRVSLTLPIAHGHLVRCVLRRCSV